MSNALTTQMKADLSNLADLHDPVIVFRRSVHRLCRQSSCSCILRTLNRAAAFVVDRLDEGPHVGY